MKLNPSEVSEILKREIGDMDQLSELQSINNGGFSGFFLWYFSAALKIGIFRQPKILLNKSPTFSTGITLIFLEKPSNPLLYFET